jgi:hypothetical protein
MKKPSSVKFAEYALWASLASYVVVLVIERALGIISSGYFFSTLIATGLFAIFPYKIGQGRNWARYAYLVISVMGYAMLAAGETAEMPRPEVILSWAHIPLDVVIVTMLFKEQSREWFGRPSQG